MNSNELSELVNVMSFKKVNNNLYQRLDTFADDQTILFTVVMVEPGHWMTSVNLDAMETIHDGITDVAHRINMTDESDRTDEKWTRDDKGALELAH